MPLAGKYIYSSVACYMSRAELFISKALYCNFVELWSTFVSNCYQSPHIENRTPKLQWQDSLSFKYQKIWSTTGQLFRPLDLGYFRLLFKWEKCVYLIKALVHSEITRDKHNNYLLTKEESIYKIKFRKDSLSLKHLCSMKVKSVKFRIVEKGNLSFRYDDRFSWISAVKLNIQKTNFISFSYILRPSKWQSMSEIDFLTVATFFWFSLILTDIHS